jgi:hypothetical protein
MAAPGWYDDPEAPGGKRYWDGNQWTEHRAAPEGAQHAAAAPPAPPAAPQAAGIPSAPVEEGPYPPARIGVAAAAGFFALLLIVGSIGTWVSVETTGGPFHIGASRGGLDRDGAITLVLAILALILIAIWAARIGPVGGRVALAAVALFFALLSVLIAIIDIADVSDNSTDIVDTSVGWGLWLVLVASILLSATLIAGLAARNLR